MTINYLDSKRISALSSDALVAHLKFNDDVTDSAGSNNGTVTGTTTYVTGKVGNAFSLNGSSYITLANESNFDFERTDPFSIAFWVNMGNNTNKMLMCKGDDPYSAGTTSGISIWTQADYLDVNINASASQFIRVRTAIASIEDSTWHHVTVSYDGSSAASGLTIYYDGVSQSLSTVSDTLTSSSILNDYPFLIGDSGAGTRDWTGKLDDLRIYSRELDQSEINVIYNGGTGTEGSLRPPNVQDNSILVEKDTGRRYWFSEASDGADNITWSTTGKVGFNISGTTISRTGSSGWGTGKIQSEDTFTVGNGTFMIEFSGNNGSTMLGFNKGTLGYYIGSPENKNDFSIYLAGGSTVEVYESGSKNYDSGGSRNANDKFRIEIDNAGLVKYYLQAGGTGSFVLKYTSSTTASGTYFIQVNAYANTSESTVHSKYLATPATWTMEPTLESDFSSSTGWSQQGTEIAINTGTGKLDWIGLRSSTNTGISYDFGAGRISTSKWRLQFDLYIQNFSGSSYTQRFGWMLSTKGSADNSDQLRDFIGGRVSYRGQAPTDYQEFNTIDDQGSTDTWADNSPYQPAHGTDAGVTPVAGTTYNIVLTRDSPTAYTMTISSGGTLLDTLNYTSYAGTSDLRYLLIQRYGDGASAGSSFNGTIDNLKFYNGVTTVN